MTDYILLYLCIGILLCWLMEWFANGGSLTLKQNAIVTLTWPAFVLFVLFDL